MTGIKNLNIDQQLPALELLALIRMWLIRQTHDGLLHEDDPDVNNICDAVAQQLIKSVGSDDAVHLYVAVARKAGPTHREWETLIDKFST